MIKQRIFDSYKQSWYSSINNSNRLEMYSRYKHEFDLENYLDCLENKKFRIALTKFRLSSERGRYMMIQTEMIEFVNFVMEV